MNKDQPDVTGTNAKLNNQLQSIIPDYDPETTELIGIEVIPHRESNNDLTLARQLALQVLYELDTTEHGIGDVINAQLPHHELSGRSVRHMQGLVHGVRDNRFNLDRVLAQFAPEWPLEQIAVVDRNILRIALYEIGIQGIAPLRVIINEAVELAKLYGADRTPSFINGVLGAISDDPEGAHQLLQLTTPTAGLLETEDALDGTLDDDEPGTPLTAHLDESGTNEA